MEICSIASPNDEPLPAASRVIEFYCRSAGHRATSGDGTDAGPWPDLATALAGVARLDEEAPLPSRRGEHLRLTVREVFSATPVDRRKRSQRADRQVACSW